MDIGDRREEINCKRIGQTGWSWGKVLEAKSLKDAETVYHIRNRNISH
jgi:hypothetical protein